MHALGPLQWHLDSAPTREALALALARPVSETSASADGGQHPFRLAVVAEHTQGLEALRRQALAALHSQGRPPDHADLAYTESPVGPAGVALLFPGQGAQYAGMLAPWRAVPGFDAILGELDALASPVYGRSLKAWFFDDPMNPAHAIEGTLAAQAALGYASASLARLLRQFGVRAGWAAGHSYGELVALWWGGAFDDATLMQLTHARGRVMAEAAAALPGSLAAIGAPGPDVSRALKDWPTLEIANLNAPGQTVVGGPREALLAFGAHVQSLGWRHALIQGAAAAFHTSRMKPALSGWRQALDDFAARGALALPHQARVVANLNAQPYPGTRADGAALVAHSLHQQVVSQVCWAETCQTLHNAGVRVFIEAGPGQVLGKLLKQNLGDRPFHLVSCDAKGEASAWRPLARLLARLAVEDALGPTQPAHPDLWPHTPTAMPTATLPTLPPPALPDRPQLDALVRTVLADNTRIVERYFDLIDRLLNAPTPATQSSELLQQMLSDSTRVTQAHLQVHEALLSAQAVSHTYTGMGSKTQHTTPDVPTASPQTLTPPTRQAQGADDADASASTRDWLVQEVARLTGFPPSTIDPQASLADLGVDSLAFMDLYGSLTQRVQVDDATAERILAARSIQDVMAALSDVRRPGDEASATPAPQLLNWLREQVAQATGFPAHALDPAATLDDLGIDSLARTDLFDRLATAWPQARELAAELFEARSMQDIVDQLSPLLNPASALDQRAQPTPPATSTSAPGAKPAPQRPAANPAPAASGWTAALIDLRTQLLSTLGPHALAAELALDEDTPFSAMALNGFDRAGLWEQTALRLSPYRLAGEALISVGSIREGLALLASLPDTLGTRARESASDGSPKPPDRLQRYRQIEVPRPLPAPAQPERVLLVSDRGAWARRVGAAIAQAIDAAKGDTRHLHWSPDGWQLGEDHLGPLDDAPTLAQGLQRALGGDPAWQLVFLGVDACDTTLDTPPLDAPALPLFILAKALSRPALPPIRVEALTLLLPSTHPCNAAARGVGRALSHEWHAQGWPVATVIVAPESDPLRALSLAWAHPGRHDLFTQGQTASERVADPHPELEAPGTGAMDLDADSVLLLYGGGVGIAAEVAVDLAQRHHLQVVAMGRTPWTGEGPAPLQADGDAGAQPDPHAERHRALARTAQRVRDAGGRFDYLSADLTQADEVQAAIAHVLHTHGRIDMVIHAAGVVEDRSLSAKPVDSFRRVFHTKAHSAWHLRHALQGVPLKYMVFFSSLVAHTGNAGQTDYCAGNEVLNAMAAEWAEAAPDTRVLSVLWSVWHETGLANRAVQLHMQRQGMTGIANADGTRRLHAELSRATVPDWLLISCPRMLDVLQAAAIPSAT